MEQKLTLLMEKIEADPSVAEKLFDLETPEEVQSSLKEQGIDFTVEEIDELRELLVKAVEKRESGELADDDLEDVAGGAVTAAGVMAGVAVVGVIEKGIGSIIRSRW